MLLSCQTLDVLHAFYLFSWTNFLTQCQVPVPVFYMFLTPFRGNFETESKRKKIPENIFSGTEEDRRTWKPSQKSPRGPTSPHPAVRGRHPGLWAPWRSPDLDLAPINSQICPKKSRDDRDYFSAAASFCLRKIPSGARPGALPEGGFGHERLLHQHHDLSDDA